MIAQRTQQRTSAPAPALMSYETGQAEPRRFGWAAAYMAAGLILLFVPGASLVILCRPPEAAYVTWGGWSVLGFVVGMGLAIGGLIVAIVPMADYLRDRGAYRRRLDQAFALELELRARSGGQIVQESYEENFFYAERPSDLIAVITAFTRARAADPRWRPTIGDLVGEGVWIGGVKLANVNTSQARLMLQTLADLGFIEGRAEGSSGEWVYRETDAALDRFEQVRRRIGARAEEV